MVFPIKKRIISDGDGCVAAPVPPVPSSPQQKSGLDILSDVASSPQLRSNRSLIQSPVHNVSANTSINSSSSPVPSSPRHQEEQSIEDAAETAALSSSSSKVSNSAIASIATKHQNNTKSGKTQRAKSFPEILFEILSNDEYSNIISWLPAGTSFAIHDISQFQCIILPKYFRKVIFRSFVRKLNRWGFRSVKRSVSGFETTFEHKLFQRDDPDNMSMNMYCKSNPISKTAAAAAGGGGKVLTHVGHNGSGRRGRRGKATVKISSSKTSAAPNKVSNASMASSTSAASHLSRMFPQGLEDVSNRNSSFSTLQDVPQGSTTHSSSLIHQGTNHPALIHGGAHNHRGPSMNEVLQRYHNGLILREIQQQRILSLVEQVNLQQQQQQSQQVAAPPSNVQQLQLLLALNQQRQQQEQQLLQQQEEQQRRAVLQQELLLQGLQGGDHQPNL